MRDGPLNRRATIWSRALRSSAVCCALFSSFFPFLATFAHGAEATLPSSGAISLELRQKLAQPGDLNLRKTTLADALFTISELWDVNLVVGEEVQGEVNGAFKQAPLHEILNTILLSNGYSYRPLGQSLVVLKLEKLGDINPLFETATIVVRQGDPKDLIEAAQLFVSPSGRIQAISSARTLVVVDYPDRVEMVRQLVAKLDGSAEAVASGQPVIQDLAQLQVAYLDPQFIPAAALKEPVNAALSEDGKLAVVEKEDKLVVIDYPAQLQLARQILDRIDVPRRQVRISAYIYDISMEDLEQIGINWNHALKGRIDANGDAQQFWDIDAITSVPLLADAVGGTMTFYNMSRNFDLNVAVQLLNSANDSRLLADPNVVTVENEPADIAIVSEIPFQQLTQTGQGGNIGTTAFREAGVKLRVTPSIANDDTILLYVEPEFSRLTGFTPEDNQPIIDRRTARSVVRVRNGHTLVMGGLRQRTDVGGFNGIPFLRDIPYLGVAFRSRDTTVRESELVVFIRPEIVEIDEPRHQRGEAALETTRAFLDQIPTAKSCPPPIVEQGGAGPWHEGHQPLDTETPGDPRAPAPRGPTHLPPTSARSVPTPPRRLPQTEHVQPPRAPSATRPATVQRLPTTGHNVPSAGPRRHWQRPDDNLPRLPQPTVERLPVLTTESSSHRDPAATERRPTSRLFEPPARPPGNPWLSNVFGQQGS